MCDETRVGTMSTVGVVTQDSTLDNIESTSGEAFAVGQARLAAGSMDRSERYTLGGTSINAVRDVTTGKARFESREGNVRTYGDEVNNNHGYNVKNPIQAGAKYLGADSTMLGKDEASISDTAVGATAIALGGLAVAGAGYKGVDKVSGGKLENARKARAAKIMGNTKVTDSEGKSNYYSKEAVETLGDDLTPNNKGGMDYKGGTIKDANKVIDQRSTSTVSNDQTNPITKNNPNPTKNAVINDSLLNEVTQTNGSNTPDYTTAEGKSNAKAALLAANSADVGRISLKQSATQSASDAAEELKVATVAGDDAKMKKASTKLGAANKILSDLGEGLDVEAKDVKQAGIQTPHVKTKQVSPKFTKDVVNFDSLGEEVKITEGAKLDMEPQTAAGVLASAVYKYYNIYIIYNINSNIRVRVHAYYIYYYIYGASI